MSKILVLITTDHEDRDEAIRSVSGAMKRAGYNFKDYDAHGFTLLTQYPEKNELQLFGSAEALVQICEPEADDRADRAL